jgi:hypothetical protein
MCASRFSDEKQVHTRPSLGPQDSCAKSQSDGRPRDVGSDVMEQNGTSNGKDAKSQKSPAAAGVNKSPKKRRKVNHGMRHTMSFIAG